MKLSELKTGESAVIVKVSGHGGFRKRVIEMGFIKGKKVDVLLNAPPTHTALLMKGLRMKPQDAPTSFIVWMENRRA